MLLFLIHNDQFVSAKLGFSFFVCNLTGFILITCKRLAAFVVTLYVYSCLLVLCVLCQVCSSVQSGDLAV